ncbi:lytic transglycosylase domain-containing protein [Ideonella sp. BN130291]|uniref:lytic transglycosylase domain-containing protein n=1 Tax=Ideonella sp. BN130291 TaxID=3112940 RepID=UPI002E26B3DA|nr:lytic transglycosylase domain-containing protein [Ideonella sp. BN130291]
MVRTVALVLLAALAVPAQAAPVLWGYVDGGGVAHVADHQVDSRYSPVLGEVSTSGARVPGKSDGVARLLTWLEFAPEVKSVQHLLREAARQTGVDSELLKAVIAVESGFNPNAVSPRGAIGLMQLMPDTADRYARGGEAARPASQRLLDARTNILTGARMLADLTQRFGRIEVALAAWNAGEGNVRKAGGNMPPFEETQAHVHMVLELYWALLQRSLPSKAQEMQLHPATGNTPR